MSEINAIRFAEPWQVSCVKIPMPEPKPGEALIKIMAAGICGSDIGAFRAHGDCDRSGDPADGPDSRFG